MVVVERDHWISGGRERMEIKKKNHEIYIAYGWLAHETSNRAISILNHRVFLQTCEVGGGD